MLFIAILSLGAFLLASVSGFFSVWGLAQTFSGIFWFVIAMGIAIEYGKLVGISFIYRFWNKAPKFLIGYLLVASAAVMGITAMGHYGFLASGYQTDLLPLKQVQAQVQLLDEERARLIERKSQIDTQIAQLPTESIRGRERLIRQFKGEQTTATKRISELDAKILELKQTQITSEAHAGPIVFIAKATGSDIDVATNYLILLLVFVFDPMAVALTLAVNVAVATRRKELDEATAQVTTEPVVESAPVEEPQEVEVSEPEQVEIEEPEQVEIEEPEQVEIEEPEQVEIEEAVEDEPAQDEPIAEDPAAVEPTVDEQPVEQDDTVTTPTVRRIRPYAGLTESVSADKVTELMNHYKYLRKKQQTPSETFTNDDAWELNAIRNVLTKAGLAQYLD